MVEVVLILDTLGSYYFAGNQIKGIQDQYFQDTLSTNRASLIQDLQSEIEYWHNKILNKTNVEKYIMDSLQNELDLLVCSDTLVQKWTEVYRIYMEYIKTDSIGMSDREALTALSRECSDLYGDIIHLARAMVNTYSTTYFDIFDNCGTELRNNWNRDQQEISVFPNPANGKVHIRFNEAFDGVLDIMSVSGKLIMQKKINNTNAIEIELFEKSGVFIFRFSDDTGNVTNKKIVVIE